MNSRLQNSVLRKNYRELQIINRLSVLAKNGFVEPLMVNQRIRSYELSDFTRDNEKIIKKMLS